MKKTIIRFAVMSLYALAFVTGVSAGEEPAKVAGKWEMSWEGPQGPMTGTLTFEQDGEKLKGTMAGPRREAPLTGSVKGKNISFSVKRETPRGEFTVEYSGTVEGDSMKGTMQMGPRTVEWTAKKQKEQK